MRALMKVAAGCVVMGLVFAPTAAMAALDPTQKGGGDPQSGLWYLSDQGIEAAHAAGYRGQGVKVAVLDTRINPEVPEIAGANLRIHEPSYCHGGPNIDPLPAVSQGVGADHGTNMASLIAGSEVPGGVTGVAPDVELLFYSTLVTWEDAGLDYPVGGDKTCMSDTGGTATSIADAMDQAVADGADIISISQSPTLVAVTVASLARALQAGVIVVASYGNSSAYNSGGRLSAANGVLTVAASDASGALRVQDDTGQIPADETIDIVGPGVDVLARTPTDAGDWDNTFLTSGSSGATAITAGAIAVVKSKYPDATNYQVLQSILTNTGPEDHKRWRDEELKWGYGPVNLSHALKVDPAQYPATNPLLLEGDFLKPKYADVMGEDGPKPVESSSPTDKTAEPSPGPQSPSMSLWVGIGLGALLIIGALLTIVLVARSKRKQPPMPYPVQGWQQPGPPPGSTPGTPHGGYAPGPHPGNPEPFPSSPEPFPSSPGSQSGPPGYRDASGYNLPPSDQNRGS